MQPIIIKCNIVSAVKYDYEEVTHTTNLHVCQAATKYHASR